MEDVPAVHWLGSVMGDVGELLALVDSTPASRSDGEAVCELNIRQKSN